MHFWILADSLVKAEHGQERRSLSAAGQLRLCLIAKWDAIIRWCLLRLLVEKG